MQTVHLLQGTNTHGRQRRAFLFHLPVHPGVQDVTNSAKSVQLAAKAMVSVARNCCGETHQQDTEGWDTSAYPIPPLPSPPHPTPPHPSLLLASSEWNAVFHHGIFVFLLLLISILQL